MPGQVSSNTPILPAEPGIDYSRSADGLLLARVGDLVFAMVPGREEHFIASAWRVSPPLQALRRADFVGHHGSVTDEAAFRARMLEQAEHRRELKVLARRTLRMRCSTPWGPSQDTTVYGDGVIRHSTASHGGFSLSTEHNTLVHELLRAEDGFYEEDCAWSIVVITFPNLFTSYERRCAERTLKDCFPDAWEAISERSSGPANPMRRTIAPSRRPMSMTGSSRRRSPLSTGPASSNASRRGAVGVVRGRRSGAFSFRLANMPSGASAS